MKRVLPALALLVSCGSGDGAPTIPTHVVTEGALNLSVTAEGNLRAVEATPISPPPVPGMMRPMKLAWIAEDGARVEKGDVILRFDPTALQQQLENGESDHASASAALARERIEAQAAAAKRDASAKLAELALAKTKRFSERDSEIYSRNEIIESEIDEGLSEARQEHAANAKKIERGLSRSKAELAMVSQRRAAMEVTRARAGLAALEVKAPHAGLLVLRRDWRGNLPRVGESVWPGRKLAEIPNLSAMEAEIFVLEVDGGSLKEGTAATITIEARPELKFAGSITHVDDLAKERVRGVPVQYFGAVVTLESTDTAVMKPGQRVRAEITLADETGLVIPRQAVFVVDGVDSVFVANEGQYEPRPVELGKATIGRVVVTSGLAAGEEIALADPREAAAGTNMGSGLAAEGGSGSR